MKEIKKEEPAPTIHTYPLCKESDMSDNMKQDAIEFCVTATEKYPDNYELAARFIKESMDKKFNPPFHVVIGEGYSHAITYQKQTLLFMFTGGNIGALVWKTVYEY